MFSSRQTLGKLWENIPGSRYQRPDPALLQAAASHERGFRHTQSDISARRMRICRDHNMWWNIVFHEKNVPHVKLVTLHALRLFSRQSLS